MPKNEPLPLEMTKSLGERLYPPQEDALAERFGCKLTKRQSVAWHDAGVVLDLVTTHSLDLRRAATMVRARLRDVLREAGVPPWLRSMGQMSEDLRKSGSGDAAAAYFLAIVLRHRLGKGDVESAVRYALRLSFGLNIFRVKETLFLRFTTLKQQLARQRGGKKMSDRGAARHEEWARILEEVSPNHSKDWRCQQVATRAKPNPKTKKPYSASHIRRVLKKELDQG